MSFTILLLLSDQSMSVTYVQYGHNVVWFVLYNISILTPWQRNVGAIQNINLFTAKLTKLYKSRILEFNSI